MRSPSGFFLLCCAWYLSCSYVLAESIIDVDTASKATTISIDNDGDLLNMPSFTLREKNEGSEANSAVYTKIKATTRMMNSGHQETIWEGVIMDKGHVGFATLVRRANGKISGTFSADEAAYSLTNLADGTLQVRKSLWRDALESGDPDDESEEDEHIPLAALKAVEKDSEIEAAVFVKPDISGSVKTSIGEGFAAVVNPNNNRELRGGKGRSLQSKPVIDVLVLITNRAMCESAGQKYGCQATETNREPLESQIPLLQSQSTNAIQSVGVSAEIRIVGVIHLEPSHDYFPGSAAANVIRTDSNIKQWRDDYGADLVAMITGPGGSYGGWAYYNSFASTSSYTQMPYYTFTHELGHNFGCYHNRENTDQDHPFAHGLQVPGVLRTLMAYACPSSSCPRIPMFSAKGYSYFDTSIGDSSHDCAREIALNVQTIADWRSSVKDESWKPNLPPGVNPGGVNPGGFPNSCFSPVNTVEVLGKGTVTIDSLEIGDYVRASDNKFSRVYSLSHLDRELQGDYLQIHTAGLERPLEISPEHMVFVNNNAVRASQVKVGDMLGENKVFKVIPIKRRGAYAPFTESGDLVVSGVLASSYVALFDHSPINQHTAAHAVLALRRCVCSFNFGICENETYTNGYSNWVYTLMLVVKKLNDQIVPVQVATMLLSVPFIAAAYCSEQMILSPLLLVGVLALVTLVHKFKNTLMSRSKRRAKAL